MAKNVNLNKQVFDKVTYQKTINTSFTELGVESIQEQLDNQPTVQEFFDMYNTLFYQINELGSTNSHEFLVKTSGEYISFEETDNLITALQNEIAALRKELLETQQQLANSLLPEPVEIETLPEIEDIEIEPISPPIELIIETPSAEEEEAPKVEISKSLLMFNLDYLLKKNDLASDNRKKLVRNLNQAQNYINKYPSKSISKYQLFKIGIEKRSGGDTEKSLIRVLNQTNNNLLAGGNGRLSGT